MAGASTIRNVETIKTAVIADARRLRRTQSAGVHKYPETRTTMKERNQDRATRKEIPCGILSEPVK